MINSRKTTGTRTIGGGGTSTPKIEVYQVVGGNLLHSSGLKGIKKVNTEMTSAPSISGGISITATYEDGIGVIKNIQTGNLVFGVNDANSGSLCDVFRGQLVFASIKADISGGSAFIISGTF